jgi:16S rRNA U1498 N3-methylase RsmE
MNKVMRIIKEKNLAIVSQNMNEYCQIVVSIRKRNAETMFETFKTIFEVDIKKL